MCCSGSCCNAAAAVRCFLACLWPLGPPPDVEAPLQAPLVVTVVPPSMASPPQCPQEPQAKLAAKAPPSFLSDEPPAQPPSPKANAWAPSGLPPLIMTGMPAKGPPPGFGDSTAIEEMLPKSPPPGFIDPRLRCKNAPSDASNGPLPKRYRD